MWLAIFSALLVSIDSLFIGVCLGSKKRCRFWHIAAINTVLCALCFVGYLIGIHINTKTDWDFGVIIGLFFILFGVWTIYSTSKCETKNIIITGLLMSIEAMLITLGLVLVLDTKTVLLPLTVALAHFVYCTVTFFCARHLRRLPPMVGHLISGIALIIYGLLAIFI